MSTAPTVISIAAFVKRYSRDKRKLSRAALVNAIGWYNADRRAGVLRENGKIVAVALVRCLTDVKQAATPFYHDEAGPIVWVDDIISKTPQGIGFLVDIARRRFGEKEVFAGSVFLRAGELRMLPWKTVERMTRP